MFNQTVSEGAVALGSCGVGENVTCRRVNFTSSELTLDGFAHGIIGKSIVAGTQWKEDIRLADVVLLDFNAAAPPSGVVDPELLVSLVVSAAGSAQMFEHQPVRLIRDGKWRQYHVVWKAANWRRVYKSCQADGKPGVCLPAAQCRAAGRTPRASLLTTTPGGINTVSGCHRITDPNIQCCPGFEDAPAETFALPVSATVPNEWVGVRIYSADRTGVSQSVLMRPAALCDDACGGVCNATAGFACDAPTKSCMCANQYPWVLGPNNKCYQTSHWAGKPEWPCAQCPRSSMYTYYNVSRPTVATAGATRLKCFYSATAKKRDLFVEFDADKSPVAESCCKYKCGCDDGFEEAPPGTPPLTPGLKSCVPKLAPSAPTPAPTMSGDCTCPIDQVCVFGQCACNTTAGWIEDETAIGSCVSDCANCAFADRCQQPPNKSNSTCLCKPQYTLSVVRLGLLYCQKSCAQACTANEECSLEEGACICKTGFERSTPTAPCTAKVFVVGSGSDTGGSATDRMEAANGGCASQCSEREDCNPMTKKCECRVPPYYVDAATGACASVCDKCIAIARSECNAAGDCECREDYTLKDGACVPNTGDISVPTGPPNGTCVTCMPEQLSEDVLVTILIAVGASVGALVVIGVIVCVTLLVRARRQREQLHANPMYKHAKEMRESAATTRSSGAATKRAPQSAYGEFTIDGAAGEPRNSAATGRAPQSAYAAFDPNRGASYQSFDGANEFHDSSQTQSYSDGRTVQTMSYSDGRTVAAPSTVGPMY